MREAILGSLAGPPKPLALSVIRPEKIVILEWLFETDRRTGHELNVWLQNHFPGWSTYFPCRTKRDVHNAIRSAIRLCRAQDIVPVLHIEAHGSPLGLHGPDRHGTEDTASWEELTEPLQILNLASACNLIVFIAACIGFAGIQAFHRGPRSPALALIGPDDDVEPNPLLNGSKEFYRRMRDIGWSISAAAESASREMAPIGLEVEPFATMALDSMVRSLLIREPNQLPPAPPAQAVWDQMFMIDIKPSNRERFGIDMAQIIERTRTLLSLAPSSQGGP